MKKKLVDPSKSLPPSHCGGHRLPVTALAFSARRPFGPARAGWIIAIMIFITIDIFVTNKIAIKISITGPRARGWRRGGGKEEEGGEEGKQQEGGKGGEQ